MFPTGTSKEHFEEFQLDEAPSWKFHWLAADRVYSHVSGWQLKTHLLLDSLDLPPALRALPSLLSLLDPCSPLHGPEYHKSAERSGHFVFFPEAPSSPAGPS